jgi:hypothetical protein
MNISPTEAEEALTAIQAIMQKTRRAISSSGAYNFMILWGAIWLIGFYPLNSYPLKLLSTSGWGWIFWVESSQQLLGSG